MVYKEILKLIFFILLTSITQNSIAQEVRVIDNKGTVKKVNNNIVTYGAEPSNPLEGDIWFDTTALIPTVKVRDDNIWRDLLGASSGSGSSLLSVDTTAANSNVTVDPTALQVSSGLWVNMDAVLPATSLVVQAGDIVDVRVNISEDMGAYNDIGDLLRFYVTLNAAPLVGATMIQTVIAGGDNNFEIAAGSLNQMFTIVGAGTLSIGIEIKFQNASARVFSSANSGIGGLQAIIYR